MTRRGLRQVGGRRRYGIAPDQRVQAVRITPRWRKQIDPQEVNFLINRGPDFVEKFLDRMPSLLPPRRLRVLRRIADGIELGP